MISGFSHSPLRFPHSHQESSAPPNASQTSNQGATMPNEIKTLLAALEEAYKGPAWHGPSLRAALKGIDAKQAAKRQGPGRHNIWELAIHAAYWKFAVRRQLSGGTRGIYNEEGRNWFVRPATNLTEAELEKSWKRDAAALKREHRALIETVKKFSRVQTRSPPTQQQIHSPPNDRRRSLPRHLPRRPNPITKTPERT